jgi:hypothetical protein
VATIRDSLLPLVDKLRGLPVIFGLRPHIVVALTRVWSGERPGVGSFTDSTFGLKVGLAIGFAKARNVSQREVIASGGLFTDQDMVVGPITPPYPTSAVDNDAIALFNPATSGSPTEVFFNIQGPGYSVGGDWFKKIAQRTDQSFRYMIWLRKTGEVFPNTSASTLLSITVTPTASTTIQQSVQFAAIGTYADSSTKDITTLVTWASSVPGVATISNVAPSQGLASTTGVGRTTITASYPVPHVIGSTSITFSTPTSVPSGTVLLLDATSSVLALGGLEVTDTSNVDTWGVATQPTAGLQMFIDAFNAGFGPGVVAGGGPDVAFGNPSGLQSSPSYMTVPSFALAIPFTLAMVCRVDGGQPGNVHQACALELSANIASSVGVRVSTGVSAGTMPSITVRGLGGGTLNADYVDALSWAAQWIEDDLCRLIIIKCDGTTFTISVNGVDQTSKLTITGTPPGTGAIPTVGTIGADHAGGNSLVGAFGLIAVWPRLTSTTDDAQTLAYARSTWALTDRSTGTQTTHLVTAGDSIMEYNIYGPYPGRLAANLGPKYYRSDAPGSPDKFCATTANVGATLSAGVNQILANYNTLKAGALLNGFINVLFDEGGVNDIQAVLLPTTLLAAQTGAAALLVLMKALVTQQIADLTAVTGGPHLIVVQTVTYGAGVGNPSGFPFYEMCATLFSQAIIATFANNAFGTAYVKTDVMDLTGDVVLGQGSKHNTFYPASYPNHWHCDTLHPTFAMLQRLAAHGLAVMKKNGFA